MAKSDSIIPLALIGVGLLALGGKRKKKISSQTGVGVESEEQRIRNVEALPESYLEFDAKEDPGDRVVPEMLEPGRTDDSTLGP